MEIVWDAGKGEKLKAERNVDLEEIKGLIENRKYLDVIENPSRPNQSLIIVDYKSYIHVVVVKITREKMVIKTCYPSRKLNKREKGLKK